MSACIDTGDTMVENKITRLDIEKAQAMWAEGLIEIGKRYQNKMPYREETESFLRCLYAFDERGGKVLFKPTLAVDRPFRMTFEGAVSYFIAGDMDYPEDKGFALCGWDTVKFENEEFYEEVGTSVVMGRYYFTSSLQGSVMADYTFGYMRTATGDVKIFLQHSSLPYLSQR